MRELVLSYNKIKLDGSIALANAVAANDTLEILDLSHNLLGRAGVGVWIGQALKANKVLLVLKLSHNALGDSTGSNVVASLVHPAVPKYNFLLKKKLLNDSHIKVNSSLRTLLLCDTNLAISSAKQLSSMLHTNKFIEKLNISSNEFCSNAVEILAMALNSNANLLYFDFSHNILPQETYHSFVQAVLNHVSLQEVNLQGCMLHASAAKYVAEAMKNNSTLVTLDLVSRTCKLDYN